MNARTPEQFLRFDGLTVSASASEFNKGQVQLYLSAGCMNGSKFLSVAEARQLSEMLFAASIEVEAAQGGVGDVGSDRWRTVRDEETYPAEDQL